MVDSRLYYNPKEKKVITHIHSGIKVTAKPKLGKEMSLNSKILDEANGNKKKKLNYDSTPKFGDKPTQVRNVFTIK